MKSTALALLFCLSFGLLSAGCDDKPRPGGPVPKASVSVAAPVLLAG